MKGKEMVALASAGFLATLTAGFLMGNVAGRNPGGGSVTRTEREATEVEGASEAMMEERAGGAAMEGSIRAKAEFVETEMEGRTEVKSRTRATKKRETGDAGRGWRRRLVELG